MRPCLSDSSSRLDSPPGSPRRRQGCQKWMRPPQGHNSFQQGSFCMNSDPPHPGMTLRYRSRAHSIPGDRNDRVYSCIPLGTQCLGHRGSRSQHRMARCSWCWPPQRSSSQGCRTHSLLRWCCHQCWKRFQLGKAQASRSLIHSSTLGDRLWRAGPGDRHPQGSRIQHDRVPQGGVVRSVSSTCLRHNRQGNWPHLDSTCRASILHQCSWHQDRSSQEGWWRWLV